MLRRIAWILASFFTRPLILVFCVGGLAWSAQWIFANPRGSYQTAYPPLPKPRLSVDSVETLEAVRREGRQAEVDAINLNALWADMERRRLKFVPSRSPHEQVLEGFKPPGEDFFRRLREFPNLRTVQLTLHGTLTGARAVAAVPALEYLSIDGSVFRNDADLSWLGGAGNLRYLDLSLFGAPVGVQALADLPRLETLVFRSRDQVTDDVLRQAAELPNLKTLVLAFYPTAASSDGLSEQGFAALAKSKSLKTLYVGGWTPEDRRTLFAMARRGAPGLDIQPALIARESPFGWFVLYPVGFLAAAIGVALSAWFRGPASHLAPHFAASHAGVALAMAAALVAFATWRLTKTFHDPLAATIVSLAVVSTVCSMSSGGVLEGQLAQRDRGRKWIVRLKVLAFFALLGLLVAPSAGPAILRGEQPGLLTIVGVLGFASTILTIVTLRAFSGAPETAPSSARATRPSSILWQTQFRPGWMFATASVEDRIERWAEGRTAWTWWQRVARWRAGNPPLRIERILLVVLGLAVLFVTVWTTILTDARLTTLDLVRGPLLIMAGALMLGIAIRVAAAWRTRMLTLPLEVLRPYDRRVLQKEMAAAFLSDLVPLVLLLAAIVAVGLNLDATWHIAWKNVPTDFVLLAVCAFPLVAGLGAAMVVIRREWLAAVIAFTAPVLLAIAVGALVALQYQNPTQFVRAGPRAFLTQLWVPALIGAGLAAWMYRRWLAMEIGTRA
jgi:hypothetical protein